MYAIAVIVLAAPVIAPFVLVTFLLYLKLAPLHIHPMFMIISIALPNLLLLVALYKLASMTPLRVMQVLGAAIYAAWGFILVTQFGKCDEIWGSGGAVIGCILGDLIFTAIKQLTNGAKLSTL